MKGIIIAAGLSSRMRPLTDDRPKCLLPINGKPILHNTLDLFRQNGIEDISIITGWQADKIKEQNVTYFSNTDFHNNNILHSLLYAREKIQECVDNDESVMVSYSDIWFTDLVVKKLAQSDNPISVVVDTDWESYYEGREDHPITEAENVVMDSDQKVQRIGKHVFTQDTPKEHQGEFIGLFKFSSSGAAILLSHVDRLNKSLEKTTPFQNAKQWQKAYMTDIFQELVDKGETVSCVTIKQNWKEFDTVQDYMRLGEPLSEELQKRLEEQNASNS